MMKKSIALILFPAALAVLSSCTIRECLPENADLPNDRVFALTTDPEFGEEPGTRAIGTDLKFSFTDTDDISIYPASGTTHMVYRLIPDSENTKKATFNSEDFDLQNGKTYYAFYPDVANTNGASSISVSFAGQAQSADNSSAHLAAYDFQMAQTTIADNSGTFQFNHKVSWFKMTVNATDAAVLKSVVISADEGVAGTAVFNLLSGEVTPSRASGDKLTLTLGGADGISVAANGSATIFVTIPSQSYTNLTLTAFDTNGKKYVKVYPTKTLEAGKYYAPALLRTDLPENTPFTNLNVCGTYSATDTEAPVGVRLYDEDNDQMSCGTSGTGENWRSFKLVNLSNNDYATFTIDSRVLTVGETYSVSYDIDGVTGNASCKAVKLTSGCVWLEDKTNSHGFIFAIE